MFRTNNNQDRVNYSDALIPPEGYILEKAVATTYSLDLEALTAVSIALGLKEEPDSELLQNPISMLNALVKVSEKILIFCEAGHVVFSWSHSCGGLSVWKGLDILEHSLDNNEGETAE